MYTDPKIQESIRKVEAARAENVKLSPARMSAEEKENLPPRLSRKPVYHASHRTE